MQRHLARSDARRKQRRVVRTSGPDDELRHCVVREQHGFAASTQSIVHGLHAKLSSICLSICVSTYLSICLSIHPSINNEFSDIAANTSISVFLNYIIFCFCNAYGSTPCCHPSPSASNCVNAPAPLIAIMLRNTTAPTCSFWGHVPPCSFHSPSGAKHRLSVVFTYTCCDVLSRN